MANMDRLFQSAWQPFTPKGVARFADATNGRLWFVQFVFALLAASGMLWFVRSAWYPTIQAAIEHLPTVGEIRAGQLYWEDTAPQLLAEGRFLSIAVDLTHSGLLRGAAHLQMEFGRGSLEVCGLFGCVDFPYPVNIVFGLNRGEAGPWWGAWRPVILVGVFCGTLAGQLLAWGILAAVYSVPTWGIGIASKRLLTLRGTWKLCGAAQLPGALFFSAAIVSYGLGLLDLVRLVVAFAVHFVVTWVYIGGSLVVRVRVPSDKSGNPFLNGGAPHSQTGGIENPFESGHH